MNAIIIFGAIGTIFLCIVAWEVWTYWKVKIKGACLGGVYRLQAKLELRNKSRISGFLLNRAYTSKVLREYKERQINAQIKAIKKRETPVVLEEVDNYPRRLGWSVNYRRGIAETTICTDIEIIED